VIPNSTNEWEFVYDMPELTDEERQEIIDAPWEVKSDSFYFAEGSLIVHNRAEYNYSNLSEQ
jgi:protein unc-119